MRHFHIGSELLKFIASNMPELAVPLNPLRPRQLPDYLDELFLKHDLNIYNFIINFNRQLRERGITLGKKENLDFSAITDGPFEIDPFPRGPLNIVDLQTAIEVYTPLYQLLLTDSDFWRASNSLQLDETIAIYASKLIGDLSYLGLVNNKHPIVPMSTLAAGYRLMLHGLAAESLHATLIQHKRATEAKS